MKQKYKKSAAFTLIEIIVVMSLTIFLMAASTQAIVGASQQFSFANIYQKVDGMVRMARSLAVSGKAQLDYVDFNNNGCFGDPDQNVAPCQPDAPPDYVTPANYGVYFEHNNDNAVNDVIVLFADNHVPMGIGAAQSVKQFDYNPNNDPLYNKGYDMVLEKYELPPGVKLQLVTTKKNNGCKFAQFNSTCTTLFYSPVFADVSVDPKLNVDTAFFYYGVYQTGFGVDRKRCEKVHKYAGNPEIIPASKTDEVCTQLLF